MQTPNWFLKKNLIAYCLLPFSIIYYFISKSVQFFRSFNQKTSKRPVICIGNIFAGGVGKTPIVKQLAEYFDAPIVMRGYKAKKGDIGDEARMLRAAGAKVYVGDRKKNLDLLNKEKSKSPIIMDDGFQNPTIKKDVSVLVFDEKLSMGNGFVLPAGPLREPPFAIKRADAIIIVRNQKSKTNNQLIQILKKYNKPVFYAENKNINPARDKYIAFAGIGYPKKFFDVLKPRAIKCISFADHYQYTKKDLDNLFNLAESENAELITTEKDWVRLPKYAQKAVKFAKLETKIEPKFFDWLKEKLNANI